MSDPPPGPPPTRAPLLRLAVQTLTRLPVSAPFDPDALRRSCRWFPLVGVGVGLVAAAVDALALRGFPPLLASLLSLAATLLLTGALHEDGLADCCDGLFGGRTRGDALRILRDSRIGAFGVLGLGTVLGLKVAAVAAIPDAAPTLVAPSLVAPSLVAPSLVASSLVAGHAVGRFWMAVLPAAMPYARPEGMAAHLAAPDRTDLAVAGLVAAAALLPLGRLALPAALASGLAALAFAWWAHRRLGGYTGDVLGATQLLAELAVLLTAAWRAA